MPHEVKIARLFPRAGENNTFWCWLFLLPRKTSETPLTYLGSDRQSLSGFTRLYMAFGATKLARLESLDVIGHRSGRCVFEDFY